MEIIKIYSMRINELFAVCNYLHTIKNSVYYNFYNKINVLLSCNTYVAVYVHL